MLCFSGQHIHLFASCCQCSLNSRDQICRIFKTNTHSNQIGFHPKLSSLELLASDVWTRKGTSHPCELSIMRQDDIWRAIPISARCAPNVLHGFYLNVKFVPRLGPLAVSSLSKKITACSVVFKVTERRPPYPLLTLRQ